MQSNEAGHADSDVPSSVTPSEQDGVPPVLEARLRVLGCTLIDGAGRSLDLPQPTVATAQALLQRFYFVASLKKFGVRDIAVGALFLACKLEETPQTIRNVINVFYHHLQLHKGYTSPAPMDPNSAEFSDWEHRLLRSEMYILKHLGFHAHVAHPHIWVLHYARALQLPATHPHVVQTAWNLCNDSFRLPLVCFYQPYILAAACLWLAARKHVVPLPETPHPWYTLLDVPRDAIDHIAAQLVHLDSLTLRCDLPLKADDITPEWTDPATIDRMLGPDGMQDAIRERDARRERQRKEREAAEAEDKRRAAEAAAAAAAAAAEAARLAAQAPPAAAAKPVVGQDAFRAALEQARAKAAELSRSSGRTSSSSSSRHQRDSGGRDSRSSRDDYSSRGRYRDSSSRDRERGRDYDRDRDRDRDRYRSSGSSRGGSDYYRR
ncbi:hypothetical protein H9P43_004975 [Blastocladiella emersonii ATCC 22665]|nr:hypothetical protein H9P43_004975 [Blastocladiella emersonii ATCC 22665]